MAARPELTATVAGTISPLGATVAQVLATDHTLAASAATAGTPHAAPTGAARFQRGRELGRGGMGRVVEAIDRQFGRGVAVKELLHAGGRERFLAEAVVTGHLEHPGVAPVYERGVGEDGTPYYAMRRIAGRTLAEVIADAPTLASRLLHLPTVIRVAETVGYAHERGVIHRDLKPANIVVGAHGDVVVLDWGIARVRGVELASAAGAISGGDGEATAIGEVLGTPAYMSPEQARGAGDHVDERADVFGLGALLYHVVTGRPPYDGPTVATLVARAAEADYTPIDQAAPEAPVALRAIIARALARAPEERYRDANALAAALIEFQTSAVLGLPSRASDRVAGGVTALTVALAVIGLVMVGLSSAALSVQGPMVWMLFGFAVLGCVLSVVEWRTAGRHVLGPIALAIAVATGCVAIGAGVTNVTAVMEQLGAPAVVADAERYRGWLAIGLYEALGAIAIGAQLTFGQVLLWAGARRRTTIAERAALRR